MLFSRFFLIIYFIIRDLLHKIQWHNKEVECLDCQDFHKPCPKLWTFLKICNLAWEVCIFLFTNNFILVSCLFTFASKLSHRFISSRWNVISRFYLSRRSKSKCFRWGILVSTMIENILEVWIIVTYYFHEFLIIICK